VVVLLYYYDSLCFATRIISPLSKEEHLGINIIADNVSRKMIRRLTFGFGEEVHLCVPRAQAKADIPMAHTSAGYVYLSLQIKNTYAIGVGLFGAVGLLVHTFKSVLSQRTLACARATNREWCRRMCCIEHPSPPGWRGCRSQRALPVYVMNHEVRR
jgi:hypothetical protein